jgi:LmbE family N-acetylglucosaminyl deacetylase
MPRALAIAAHPDDIEFLMAGTLLLLKDAGYEIHYFNLADGCCGSSELDAATIAAIRLAEAQSAAAFAGAVFHPPLCRDLEVFYERSLLAGVASIVRRVSPEILLTHSPVDYMEDHTNACRLAVSAAFVRGMPNFPAMPASAPSSQPIAVYHAQPFFHRGPIGEMIRPEFCVDIGAVQPRKIEMLSRHASQKKWLDVSQGQDSYLETLRRLDAECAAMCGRCQHAEGWRRHWHVGFSAPEFDPLRRVLSDKISPVTR